MSLACRRILSGIVITFCVLASSASAQNSAHQGTPAESKTGQSGVSTYATQKQVMFFASRKAITSATDVAIVKTENTRGAIHNEAG